MIHELCLVSSAVAINFYIEPPEVRDQRFVQPLIEVGYNPREDDLRFLVNSGLFPTCDMVSSFAYKWVPGAIAYKMGAKPLSFVVKCSKNICSCEKDKLICVNRRSHERIGYKD